MSTAYRLLRVFGILHVLALLNLAPTFMTGVVFVVGGKGAGLLECCVVVLLSVASRRWCPPAAS